MSIEETPTGEPAASEATEEHVEASSTPLQPPALPALDLESAPVISSAPTSPAPSKRAAPRVVAAAAVAAVNHGSRMLSALLTARSTSSRRRKVQLVLALALLLGTLSSATLLVLARSPDGGQPLALSAAPTSAPPSPTVAQTLLASPSSEPTATPQPQSPQGCVGGLAPAPGQGPLGPVYSTHGYPGVGNEVALTFDDGPNPNFTPQILSDLETAGVHATFFVVGRHAQAHPELVQREWADGNAVGNHTFDHEWVPGLSRQKLQATLDATKQVIRDATGDPCVWLFRPPYGDLLPPVKVSTVTPVPGVPTPTPQRQVPVTVTQAWQVIHASGYTPINWDTSGHDWLLPGVNAIVREISGSLRPGAIILMHDGAPDTEKQDRSQTVAALPAVLAAIRAHGLQPVTLPQLLYDAGIVKRPVPPTPTPRPGHNAPDVSSAVTPEPRMAATP